MAAAVRRWLLGLWHELRGWHDWRATRVTDRASLRGPLRTIVLECECGAHEVVEEFPWAG